jgi:hypothetical protein
LRSGFDSVWEAGKGINFFCDGALSALASYLPTEPQAAEQESYRAFRKGIVLAEALLGCQYVASIFQKNTITCSLGYECNYVFNKTGWIEELSPTIKTYEQGVSLQGVSLTFRLDF